MELWGQNDNKCEIKGAQQVTLKKFLAKLREYNDQLSNNVYVMNWIGSFTFLSITFILIIYVVGLDISSGAMPCNNNNKIQQRHKLKTH